MNITKTIFWNVDTQKDFIDQDGKLYVPGAELLKDKWKFITKFAKKNNIRVVNTADYHYINSPEIDPDPDMINTFPEHCMAGSNGAHFIKETDPDNPTIFDWNKEYNLSSQVMNIDQHRNIVIRKDVFDVFSGNPNTNRILEILDPERVFVYGVTTNICVNYAVLGLIKKVKEIYVIVDAIKELKGIPMPYEKWEKMKVKSIKMDELSHIFG